MTDGSCELRARGRAYPRTCAVCGLGPCTRMPSEAKRPMTDTPEPSGKPDVVERVAEASFNKYWAHEWKNEDGVGRAAWLGMTRAAIEAMREPTDAMIKAAYENGDLVNYPAEDAWQAMIEKALEE